MDNNINFFEEFAKNKGYDELWLKRLSFTNILVCANMMQTMFSKTQDGITSKQWLLLTIAINIDEAPTLSEMGKFMGCSRQNVKQIAQVLNKNGYLKFTKIDGDKNTMRIVPTEKWFDYNEKNSEMTSNILEKIFSELSNEELKIFFESYIKITNSIEKINNELNKALSH